jgi:hypothetical protein
LIGLTENDESQRYESPKDILSKFSVSEKVFTKNDDIKDYDETKKLVV